MGDVWDRGVMGIMWRIEGSWAFCDRRLMGNMCGEGWLKKYVCQVSGKIGQPFQVSSIVGQSIQV